MTCPRNCGIDISSHHSTDTINGQCDTGPMSLDDMWAWFQLRGADQAGSIPISQLVKEHYGKTETELDEIYEAMHGSMA